jgi:hypothetical protein
MFIEEPQQLADEAVVGGNCAIAYAGERFLAVLFAKRCQDVRVIGMDSPCEPHNMLSTAANCRCVLADMLYGTKK